MYQKGIYYSDIRIFNGPPKTIKDISSKPNKFKIPLKHFLYAHSPHSLTNLVNPTKYQKGVYRLVVRVFSMLPPYIKTGSDNPKKFELILQKCLYENFFYSLD